MSSDLGILKISDDVIAVCAVRSAMETAGVADMAPGITDSFSKNILDKESTSKGVKVNREDDEIILDIYVIVDYGVRIPSVAWNIQENVKKEVENISGSKVRSVNIHVQGVYFKEDK